MSSSGSSACRVGRGRSHGRTRRLVAAAALLLGVLAAGPGRAEVVFAELRQAVPVERVQATLEQFARHQSRVAGYPGADSAARFIEATFRQIGLDRVTVHEYDVSVPMERSSGWLEVAGDSVRVPIHGLWPNLVKTPTLPEGGTDAHLIDGHDGSYTALDGKQPDGAFVLLDFNTADAWLNSAAVSA